MANLYVDVHVPHPVVSCLRQFGVDVLLVQDDGRRKDSDEQLLIRSTELGRVLLTLDRDFVVIGRRWQREQRPFAGIARITADEAAPQEVAESLMILLGASQPDEIDNQIFFVPF